MSMDKLCKNCKFWERDDGILDMPKAQGECHNTNFIYTGTLEINEPDEFVYSDYEGYAASFYTGENFGCVHFRAKP